MDSAPDLPPNTPGSNLEVDPNSLKMDSDDGETGKQPFHTSNMSSATLQQNPADNSDAHASCHHTEVPDCLHTCTHPYHSSYSEEYLPPLIFRLDTLVTAKQTSVGLLIENGKVAEDADGCPIRDFPFLPRYISVKVSGWLLEYWMRTDTRLTYRDIKARMTVPASELPLDNTLNMRREREARTPLKLSCLTTRRGQIARKEVERVESWTPDQVSYNTTMDIEYKLAEGKKVPHRLRSKTLISAEPQYYPLDTFLDNGEIHEPGPRVKETIALFYRLSDTATAMDLSSWGDLPLEYLPKSWRPRSFPSRTKSGPRRRYMSKRIAMEDDDIMDWQSDTEQDGNGTPSASGHEETGDSSNLGESVPTYNMSDEEESLQFSGLPSVAHCNDSPGIAGSIVDRMVFEAESCHNTPRTNAPVSIGQWNPINGRKKLGFAAGLEECRGNTFMELARSERLMSQSGRGIRNAASRRTFSPFESSGQAVNSRAGNTFGRIEEPSWVDSYHFNSEGHYATTNDKHYGPNAHQMRISSRANPFVPENAHLRRYDETLHNDLSNAYPTP